MSSFSKVKYDPLKITALHSFETPGMTRPTTQGYITYDQIPNTCAVRTSNLTWNRYATCNLLVLLQLPVLYCRAFNFFCLDPILSHMSPTLSEFFFKLKVH